MYLPTPPGLSFDEIVQVIRSRFRRACYWFHSGDRTSRDGEGATALPASLEAHEPARYMIQQGSFSKSVRCESVKPQVGIWTVVLATCKDRTNRRLRINKWWAGMWDAAERRRRGLGCNKALSTPFDRVLSDVEPSVLSKRGRVSGTWMCGLTDRKRTMHPVTANQCGIVHTTKNRRNGGRFGRKRRDISKHCLSYPKR